MCNWSLHLSLGPIPWSADFGEPCLVFGVGQVEQVRPETSPTLQVEFLGRAFIFNCVLSPVICCSKNTEHCFQSRYLFWSCTSRILTTSVKTAPGSVAGEWLESLDSKIWKASTSLPASVERDGLGVAATMNSHTIWIWPDIHRVEMAALLMNPSLLLSAYLKTSQVPWSPLEDAHTKAFLPTRALPCCVAFLSSSHLDKPFSSHIYQMKSQRTT